MSGIDVTAIINFHAEGEFGRVALVSVAEAKAYAEARGVTVEILAVLDQPDPATIAVLDGCSSVEFSRLAVDHGDVGLSRNAGARAARGEWVSFLDADNVWPRNWLAAAHAAALEDPRPVIWRPQASVAFGARTELYACVDMEDADFDPLNLALANYWPQVCLARRELLLAFPYPATDLSRQIGYEDWAWNLETVDGGCLHKVVQGTVYARRVKQRSSLWRQTFARRAMPNPTQLFRHLIEARAS
jgi:glycosyltransferase involved in cell wall biosynthesis